ncbi:hypothetical protein [Microbacterium lacus]|uniref:hypothetical protein n=1 Tax=Microbacterium lacus TaxID=415217 RepID=UPI000C2C9B53|nr:hypothetical protein [Microbacterium lacus]
MTCPAKSATQNAHRTPPAVRGLRRAAIVVVIVSLLLAGVLGIVALLSGDFGETQGRILLTTLVVAAFGLTALCHLAIASHRFRLVGYIGIAASVAALIPALVLIWSWFDLSESTSDWFRALGVLTILAVTLAQANLLLRSASSTRRIVHIGLTITLVAAAIVAIMLWLPILTEGDIPGSNTDYWRFFGVIAIIDVIGTIAVPIIGLVVRGRPDDGSRLALDVPGDLLARIDAAAAVSGMDRERAAVAALRRGLDDQPTAREASIPEPTA